MFIAKDEAQGVSSDWNRTHHFTKLLAFVAKMLICKPKEENLDNIHHTRCFLAVFKALKVPSGKKSISWKTKDLGNIGKLAEV